MSLLKRIQRAQQNEPDEQPSEPEGEPSAVLQLCSAWSVWPAIKKIAALRVLAENVQLSAEPYYERGTWAVVDCGGVIYANPFHLAPAEEWTFVLAHLLAHLGLRHHPTPNAALTAIHEMTANALIIQLGIGMMPEGFLMPHNDWRTNAQAVYADWQRDDVIPPTNWMSAAGSGGGDVISRDSAEPPMEAWAMMLTQGLLESAGGKGGLAPWATIGTSRAKQALHWFVGNFPLLSALAAHFTVIEDRDSIEAFQINVAAVIAERMEILVNPDLNLTPAELRFIMGHELMHVGLLHHKRREDRDPFIWNVACDFVINAWLIEMGVGEMPPRGGLYNPAFAGLSSDEIYDKLMENADYVKTLVTFRGEGVGDILPPGARGNPLRINGQLAAELAEELMRQGINAHMQGKHGLLPAGLLEMVAPTYAPPPEWKMALSRWFDSHFDQLAPARSYARLSRRQQATPDIPRPRFSIPQLPDGSSVFGVLLDTSGSMSNQLLGQCLGAIAALAAKHSIKQVRLVFCDAEPHDEGYVPTKRLYEPMPVKGRGGTRLQPGVHLLQTAKDFPKDAPILIITDGGCDKLDIKRDHAFLLPEGNRLPFNPVGPVFALKQVGA